MAKIEKKYIIAGVIAVVTFVGAFAYLQYKKMMDYVIKFKGIKIKKISLNLISFDLFLDYTNNSDITFTLKKQVYDVYVNNIFVTTLENTSPNTILKNTTSVLGLNVAFNPKEVLKKIKKNASDLLTNSDKIIIKVDVKLKVKVGIITITVPYVYEDTLKNMMG